MNGYLKTIDPKGTVTYADGKQQALREIGKLSTSLGKPRTHVLTYTDPDTEPMPRKVPALPPGAAAEFTIPIGPKPTAGHCVIRIGLESQQGFENARLSVKVNGVACQQTDDVPRDPRYKYDNTRIWHVVKHVSETGARVMQFEADLEALQDGHNRITVINNAKQEQALTWLEMHLY